MNRYIFASIFLVGALAILWVATGFFGSNSLALLMTAVIGVVYALGALELQRFRQATQTLTTALSAMADSVVNLDESLASLHPSLQNTVRLRIEGERIGLPGPELTPYLVGLLVMLGMLGTFLGMVVTLNGAVFALDGATDIHAIGSTFAAPIRGLGLAFGTSVAGVASSAMLGLLSAFSRRDRLMAAQMLDKEISTTLRRFSLTHQRQETFRALQLQSQALPAVVHQLQTMMEKMESTNLRMTDGLLANQARFHSDVKHVYSDLARSIDATLRTSLTEGAHAAGESIKPVVEGAMAGISHEAKSLQERLIATTESQLHGISVRFEDATSAVARTWTQALASQERTNETLISGLGKSLDAFDKTLEQRTGALLTAVHNTYSSLLADQALGDRLRLEVWTGQLIEVANTMSREWHQTSVQTQSSTSQTLDEIARLVTCSEELAHSRIASETVWTQQHVERTDQLVGMLRSELGTLRDEEAQRGKAAVERLGELQAALTSHMSTLGTALEDPITQLIHTASEAPRAAAEVISKLRQEVSNSVARDNALLEERVRIMGTLNALLETINHASMEQRAVIDSLVASTAAALHTTGNQFSDKVDAEAVRLAEIAANVTSSSVEVSALSETLGFAVNTFSAANEKLITNLLRIEQAMDRSMARSDDQLAYYVAQAREIIDLSIMAQKDVVEDLRQLSGRQPRIAPEIA